MFNIILVMNFFRGLPKAIEESAIVDGAGQFTIMLKIILPLSKASIATITLFSVINNWNAWYDGLLYNKMCIRDSIVIVHGDHSRPAIIA